MTPAWLADLAYWLPVLCPGLAGGALLLWLLRDGGPVDRWMTRDGDRDYYNFSDKRED
jgi:hypothetical protein